MSRPARATIDLAALRQNCRLAGQLASDSELVAVVKANAYGHGAVAVAQTLEPMVTALAVACSEEALQLRDAGIRKPILLLEGPFEAAEIAIASRHDFWLMLNNREQLQWLLEARVNTPLKVWLKIDTGMHRLGFAPPELPQFYRQLQASSNAEPGLTVATHFAAADQLQSDFTRRQMEQFRLCKVAQSARTSLANSAAILAWPGLHGDFVRPGIMLYGSSPFAEQQPQAQRLRPAMWLTSQVIALHEVAAGDSVGYGRRWTAARQSRIATVAIGYGDGYPRHAPNGTPVLVAGQRAALAGTVSMDMITVDVTELKDVEPGSPVELWGKTISVDEVAGLAGTIGYELLTRMPMRTPRVYIDSDRRC